MANSRRTAKLFHQFVFFQDRDGTSLYFIHERGA